jgi:glutathione peroxidase
MSFHNFKVRSIKGGEIDFSSLKGKKVMLVNTTSACGLTPQYEQLEELYETTDRANFEIIGFPCNDFAGQEPGSEAEILTFCATNYGVTFPLTEKIHVKGSDCHPIYQWLLDESVKKGQHEQVKWNFHKFLIDENGAFVRSVEPMTLPTDTEIVNWIKK